MIGLPGYEGHVSGGTPNRPRHRAGSASFPACAMRRLKAGQPPEAGLAGLLTSFHRESQ